MGIVLPAQAGHVLLFRPATTEFQRLPAREKRPLWEITFNRTKHETISVAAESRLNLCFPAKTVTGRIRGLIAKFGNIIQVNVNQTTS